MVYYRRFVYFLGEKFRMKKILIVEDDQHASYLMRKIVEYLEFNCDDAKDGEKAIEMYNKNNYDLIFMDLRLPKKSGIEVIEYIRNIEKKTDKWHTPIVVLTAFPSEKIKKRCAEMSVMQFLEKPFNIQEIRNTIIRTFSNYTYHPKEISKS